MDVDGRFPAVEDTFTIVPAPRSSYVTGAAWSADGGTVPIII